MSSQLAYLPVLLLAVFLNTADIYFLQTDRFPQLYRAPSYWLYMVGHALVALAAAYLLYDKSGLEYADWPIVTMVGALSGFSLLQSWTLKFGDKGIDARDLFDAWKRRVIEDLTQSNTSRKRGRQLEVADKLQKMEEKTAGRLNGAIVQLAPSVGKTGKELLDEFDKSKFDAPMLKAQFIASIDLDFAENLAKQP